MKLTDVVAQHGYEPADELGQIENAKLYARGRNGMIELLCVQKQGDKFRIDNLPLVPTPQGLGMMRGRGFSNQYIPKDRCEEFLNEYLAL